MNRQANIREFRKLEQAIVEDEADIEAMRWRQAELAAEAVAGGMTRTEYGRQVGKSDQTISVYVRAWERWGSAARRNRPRWADAWATIKARSDEIVTRAEQRGRETERQVPTRHDDRVEMAAKLLNDPKVAKAAIKTVLDTPSPARAAIDKVMYDQRATKRQKERDWAEQRRSAAALPLPAYMARMVEKMNEWSLGLAGLYEDLDELPDGRGRELVAKAAGQLAEQAQRWVDKLEGRPDLRVIEGKASRARVSA